jgi:uncharacterized protein (DUF302 family)
MSTEGNTPTTGSTHEIRRFDLPVAAGWAHFIDAFETAVPPADPAAVMTLIADGADLAAVQRWGSAAAPNGFQVLWKDDNVLLKLFRHTQRCITYTIGNLVMAETMYQHDPTVLLYVPLRLALHETADGNVVLSFDQPSTALASLSNPDVTAVAKRLDAKLAELLEHLGITAPAALKAT